VSGREGVRTAGLTLKTLGVFFQSAFLGGWQLVKESGIKSWRRFKLKSTWFNRGLGQKSTRTGCGKGIPGLGAGRGSKRKNSKEGPAKKTTSARQHHADASRPRILLDRDDKKSEV